MHADKIPAALSFSQRGGEAISQFQRRLPHALYEEDMRIRPGVPQYMADRRKLPPAPILGFIARQTQCQSLLQRQRRQHGPLPAQDVAQIPAFRYQVRDIEIPMDDSDWLTGIQAGDPRFHPVEQRAKRLPAAAQGGQAGAFRLRDHSIPGGKVEKNRHAAHIPKRLPALRGQHFHFRSGRRGGRRRGAVGKNQHIAPT